MVQVSNYLLPPDKEMKRLVIDLSSLLESHSIVLAQAESLILVSNFHVCILRTICCVADRIVNDYCHCHCQWFFWIGLNASGRLFSGFVNNSALCNFKQEVVHFQQCRWWKLLENSSYIKQQSGLWVSIYGATNIDHIMWWELRFVQSNNVINV